MRILHVTFLLAACLGTRSTLFAQTTDASSVAAIGGTAVTTGSDWEFRGAHQHWYVVNARSAFDGGAYQPWVGAPLTSKKTAGTNSSTTADQKDTDSEAKGSGNATVTSSGGNIWINYDWTLRAVAEPVTDHAVITQAQFSDPTPLFIGSTAGDLRVEQTLRAGTTLQQPDPLDTAVVPKFNLRCRFGVGLFDGGAGSEPLPAVFWADPTPAGAFDLLSVDVFENPLGAVEAIVTLIAPPTAEFSASYSMTPALVEAVIEGAGWLKDPTGLWTLSEDIDLGELILVNNNPSNEDLDAAVGTMASTMMYAAAGPPLFTPYCFGDGTGAPCACGANGAPGAGCINTSGAGAVASGSGSPSFMNDTFAVHVTGTPSSQAGILIRGNNQIAIPIGDGILCTAGMTLRSQVQLTFGGGTTYSNFNGAPFGSVANVGVPTNFQFWFRDPSNPCGGGFNFSNAVSVLYVP